MLGSLLLKDLNNRIALGKGSKYLGRAERKQKMTPDTTTRWASTITRVSADMYERGIDNLQDVRDADVKRIGTIRKRLDAVNRDQKNQPSKPAKSRDTHKTVKYEADEHGQRRKVECRSRKQKVVKPYATKEIKAAKNLKLQKYEARHTDTVKRLNEGRPSIVLGGKPLAKQRHLLDGEPPETREEWLQRWKMSRLFLAADGQSGSIGGNQTIRVLPDDRADAEPDHFKIVMRLPNALRHLSNTTSSVPTYEFSGSVTLKNKKLKPVWDMRMKLRLSVGYSIRWVDGVWKLFGAWNETSQQNPPTLEELRGRCALAIDFNEDHFACLVIDKHGNTVGEPADFSFSLEGSTKRRLGKLAAVIQKMMEYAEQHGCEVLIAEDLDFKDIKDLGREHGRQGRKGKRYRKMLHNFPTAAFKALFMSMVHNRGSFKGVIVVDPAYTSKWGKEHWFAHLNRTRRWDYSGHHAAAYVIGRRGLGYGAKRRHRKAASDQSIQGKQSSAARNEAARTSPRRGKEHPAGTTTRSKDATFAEKQSEQAFLNGSERRPDEQTSTHP